MSLTGFDPTISLLVQSETLHHEPRPARGQPRTHCLVQLDFRLLIYLYVLHDLPVFLQFTCTNFWFPVSGSTNCLTHFLKQQVTRSTLTLYSLLLTWCTNSLIFNNYTFCPHCIYVFCIYLRTNSDLCHLQYKLIGFYNRDEKCLLRGTNWVFK